MEVRQKLQDPSPFANGLMHTSYVSINVSSLLIQVCPDLASEHTVLTANLAKRCPQAKHGSLQTVFTNNLCHEFIYTI